MHPLKSLLLATGTLVLLSACSSGGNQAAAPVSSAPASPAASASPAVTSTSTSAPPTAARHDAERKSGGGMVVESGAYHLELAPEKEGSETHLDLFLQKSDTHESVANAKVMAQVQLPNGSQKAAEMTYDAQAKHYTAKIDSAAAGEYKVVIQSEIGGEKVNARYTFKQ